MYDEKPCYFCGKTDKIRTTTKIGEIPVNVAICKLCSNMTLFLSIIPGSREEISKDTLPQEVKQKED